MCTGVGDDRCVPRGRAIESFSSNGCVQWSWVLGHWWLGRSGGGVYFLAMRKKNSDEIKSGFFWHTSLHNFILFKRLYDMRNK